MDYDELVWRLAGPEGGRRYVRVGVLLMVMGIIAISAVPTLPLYTSGYDDRSLYLGDLRAEPDDQPFGVPNSDVVGHAYMAIAGGVLTVLMGLVLVLEGRLVINLRRLLAWDAETRATSLYALATVLPSTGMLGGFVLVGLAYSMPVTVGGGVGDVVNVDYQATSPAGLAVALVLGTATVAMFAMAYYSCVLSTYRGGGDPRHRGMARLAMYGTGVALVGLIALRSGTLFWSSWQLAYMGDTLDVTHWFTHARVSYMAAPELGNIWMKLVDMQLLTAEVLLLVSVLLGLGGMVGVSAYSLGGTSLRVRRATALPVLSDLPAGIAAVMAASAFGLSGLAVEESIGLSDLDVRLGLGMAVGVLCASMVILMGLLFMRLLGAPFVIRAFAFTKMGAPAPPSAPSPTPDEDGIVVESGEGAPTPTTLGTPGGKVITRNLLLVVGAILVALVVMLAAFGIAAWRGPGNGDGGDGGRVPIDIEALPKVTLTLNMGSYLMEGDSDPYYSNEVIGGHPDDGVYLYNRVSAEVTWTDEPDAGILWTNQPDTFRVTLYDEANINERSGEGTNPQGARGQAQATWSTDEYWLSWGNLSLVDTGEADVFEDALVEIEAVMEEAGNQVTRLGRTQADDGNIYQISIVVYARYYEGPSSGQ